MEDNNPKPSTFQLRSGNVVWYAPRVPKEWVSRLIVIKKDELGRDLIISALMGTIADEFYRRNSKGKLVYDKSEQEFERIENLDLHPDFLSCLSGAMKRKFTTLENRIAPMTDTIVSTRGGACTSRYRYEDWAGIPETKEHTTEKWRVLYMLGNTVYQETRDKAVTVWNNGSGNHSGVNYYLCKALNINPDA